MDAEREDGPLPSGSSVPSGAMLSAQRLKSRCGIALTQKMISTASAASVTTSVTLKESSTPTMLSARKMAYINIHHTGWNACGVSKMRSQIGADEEDDHRRRENIFDVLAKAGDEAAPWPHRRAREGIGRAGMRQRRRHLGDAKDEAEIHDHDDDAGDQHAAPAARGEVQDSSRRSVPR